MKRFALPRPPFVADDNDLFLINVLLSSVRAIAKESMGPDAEPMDVHALFIKLVFRGYRELFIRMPAVMTEDGVEDFLTYLRKEIAQ